ncbi:Putative Ig [uncultured Caudovirales phage]|uniref:Ig n=1 Tax=uncultured Caudovirales phage TaxID=2100421 RepID=A0A6J7WHM2_9CAUD|nr:Putative Ig [uncultured Caudovirales phage]
MAQSKLSWVTPTGSFASIVVGSPITVALIAANAANNGATLTYSLINGTLPPGMTLNSNGTITGTPGYESVTDNYFTSKDYSFIARVASSDGSVLDGSFIILLTNIVNGDFTWVTPAGNLGTVPDGAFYSLQLQVIESHGNPVTFTRIAGELPPGMQILSTGYIQGVPTLLNPIAVNESQAFRFSVRARNSLGHINDRSFILTVTNIYGPIVEPTTSFLGSFFDGTYYRQQLSVIELNPNVQITWAVSQGQLPPGVVLDQTGLLSGYIQPIELVGVWGPANYDGQSVDVGSGVVTERAEYDYAPYDFNQLNQSLSYTFTIQAYDGANYDLQDYVINVVSRTSWTADNNTEGGTNNTYLTIDALNVYNPVILNTSRTLPIARQGSYYAFKFDGYDFQGDELTYTIANTTGTFDAFVADLDEGFDWAPFDSFEDTVEGNNNLPGLILDAKTGWLYGKLFPQSTNFEEYTFGIQVYKTRDSIKYTSATIFFTLPIIGDVNNLIEWITPADLGSINNGAVSELNIQARSLAGRTDLIYSLYDRANVPIRLPQGLQLLESGNITGRVTFEALAIDDFNTTFDGDRLTLDREYNFTVKVETSDGSASAIQQFTLKLNVIDNTPYESLYLTALPAHDQRQIYYSVIDDQEIFDTNPGTTLIYRADDPWFGINRNLSMMFLPGLTPSQLTEYETAISQNHWTKTYNFGDIKTAVVLDDFYNVKYEVVYIEMLDPGLNSAGKGPGLTLDLTNTIANPYIDAAGNEYKILYPNNSNNMMTRLEDGIGYADQSSLPDWMTSNQPDPTNVNKFRAPLGYTKAVVVAYTKPGASKLIAYRLKNSGINFNNIQFTVDRYNVDNYYSTYYDTISNQYLLGRETTFDVLPNKNIGTLVATVNYGVHKTFAEINGRPTSYINSKGGIDGDTHYRDGDTLIFIKQEHFNDPGPYDGWIYYKDAYIGDNILTTQEEGYGSGSFDTYSVVPGYLEKIQQSVINSIFTANAVLVDGQVNTITVSSTANITSGMDLTFNLIPPISTATPTETLGGLFVGNTYAVSTVVDSNTLTVASSDRNSALYNASGTTITGYSYSNQRGGVWRINIVDDVVVLSPLLEVQVGQRIRISNGMTYGGGAIVSYVLDLGPNQTVPYYIVYKLAPEMDRKKTTFNAGTTRFFNYRDQYYTPGSHDKYVKFPQYGVFN